MIYINKNLTINNKSNQNRGGFSEWSWQVSEQEELTFINNRLLIFLKMEVK